MSTAVVWEAFHNENGERYYYNPATNESSWTLPPGAVFIDKEKEAGKELTVNPVVAQQFVPVKTNYLVNTTPVAFVTPTTASFNVQSNSAPKASSKTNKRNIKIFGGIATLVIIAVVVGLALFFTMKKSAKSSADVAALDQYTAANYAINEKVLSLNSAAMMNSDASALLSTIFPSLGGALNFTNSVPALTTSGPIDINALIAIGQSLGIDVTPLYNLLKNALSSKVFTGTLNRNDRLERPNGVFTADTNCVVALFYKLNEVKFTPETIQFAVQCQLSADWTPSNLPALYSFGSFESSASPVTAPSWLNEWSIVGNASIVISSLDYEFIDKVASDNPQIIGSIDRLPRFLEKGINIFAAVKAANSASSLFNGLDGLLTQPLASLSSVQLQFSLPLDITLGVDESTGQLTNSVKVGFLSSNRPVKGLIDASVSLKFNPNTGLTGSGVTFYIEGYSSAVAQVKFETSVNLILYGGSTVNTWLVGGWTRETGLLILDGVSKGQWAPFVGSKVVPANDPRQVVVFNDAQLHLNLSATPSGLSLNEITFQAQAKFLYEHNNQIRPLFASGRFTQTAIAFSVQFIPIQNVASLITTILADAKANAATLDDAAKSLDYLSQNIPQILQAGDLSFGYNNGADAWYNPFSYTIRPGFSLHLRKLQINTAAFKGAIHSVLSKVDPDYTAEVNVQIFLPVKADPTSGLTTTNYYTTFSLVVDNIKISNDFRITSFAFIFDKQNVAPYEFVFDTSAEISVNLPALSPEPINFGGSIQYFNTPVPKFALNAYINGFIQPKFAPWLKVSQPALQLIIYPANGTDTVRRYSVDISAQVQFLFAPNTQPIAAKLTVVDDIFVFSAKGISMANIYPALANYIGVPLTQQAVDIVLTNANAKNPITINRFNSLVGVKAPQLSPSLASLSPLLANLPKTFSLAQPGLNLFANNLPLVDATNNALSLLGTSLSNVNLNFSAYFPLSITDEWKVSLETSAPISVTKIFTLNHAYFSFDIIPSPLRITTAIGAAMTMNIPFNPPITVQADGAYSTVNNNLTFSGIISEWDKPFGLPFLTIGQTKVKFASYKRGSVPTNTGSLYTSASFRNGPTVGLCGALIGGNAALSTTGLGVQSIRDLICQVLGICGDLPVDIIAMLGLDQVRFGINLASDNISPSDITGTDVYCNLPTSVRKGVSITTSIDLKAAFLQKLKDILPGIEQFVAQWQFVINLPFLAPSVQGVTPLRSIDHRMRLQALNPSHPALRVLSRKELSDRANFLQGLAGSSFLVFAYENQQINFKVTDWFTLDGIGINADSTAVKFGLWTKATVQLKSNEDPLVFYVSGAINGAQVALTGQLSIANGGWVNPFGLKGLTVYNVGMTVALGPPAGISGFGLNFKLKFGPKIVVAFAGAVSTASIDSYLSGAIYSESQGSEVSPISLGDLFLVVEQMTGKKLNVPSLPGPDILSLTKAAFTIATASGTDPNGNSYTAGFRFTAIAMLFGIEIATDVGTVQRLVNGVPMVDFVLNLVLQFNVFNQKIIDWIRKIIPFNIADWLQNGKSLCDIACIKQISITGFSIIDIITAQRFPILSLTVAIMGNEKSFTLDLNFDRMKNPFSLILDSIKSAFNWDFCIVDLNCGGGKTCSHDTWKCVDACPAGQVKVPVLGCFKKLGFFNLNTNYVAPADWYIQAGVDPYGDPAVFEDAYAQWVQTHAN